MNEKVNARIQALEAELAGLKKDLAEPKKEGRFRAKKGEIYKAITTSHGKAIVTEFGSGDYKWDNDRYDNFNHFRHDTDEADRMAEKTKLMFEMTARVKELNGDWVANWNGYYTKYGLLKVNNYCVIQCELGNNSFIFGLSVQSREHAKILLEEFKERIEKYY